MLSVALGFLWFTIVAPTLILNTTQLLEWVAGTIPTAVTDWDYYFRFYTESGGGLEALQTHPLVVLFFVAITPLVLRAHWQLLKFLQGRRYPSSAQSRRYYEGPPVLPEHGGPFFNPSQIEQYLETKYPSDSAVVADPAHAHIVRYWTDVLGNPGAAQSEMLLQLIYCRAAINSGELKIMQRGGRLAHVFGDYFEWVIATRDYENAVRRLYLAPPANPNTPGDFISAPPQPPTLCYMAPTPLRDWVSAKNSQRALAMRDAVRQFKKDLDYAMQEERKYSFAYTALTRLEELGVPLPQAKEWLVRQVDYLLDEFKKRHWYLYDSGTPAMVALWSKLDEAINLNFFRAYTRPEDLTQVAVLPGKSPEGTREAVALFHNTPGGLDTLLAEGIASGHVVPLAETPAWKNDCNDNGKSFQHRFWTQLLGEHAPAFLERFDMLLQGRINAADSAVFWVQPKTPTATQLQRLGVLGHNGGQSLFVMDAPGQQTPHDQVLERLGINSPEVQLNPESGWRHTLAHELAARLGGATEYQSQLITLASLLYDRPPKGFNSSNVLDPANIGNALRAFLEAQGLPGVTQEQTALLAADLRLFVQQTPGIPFAEDALPVKIETTLTSTRLLERSL
ncbi:MAG: hypothetical protein JW937_01260 [Candidatus Omnitrophica bacterium]|nr:hypothetical protein [Candidatus Omnitrophota bacterium]